MHTDNDIDLQQFELKNTLNPSIWRGEEGNYSLKSGVHNKLLSIATKFWESLGFETDDIDDILILGSSCNYNWSDVSDIDLHIVVNFADINDDVDILEDYFKTKSRAWNESHEGLHIGFSPVEVFVQDTVSTCGSNASYSLVKDKWITEPKKSNLEDIKNGEEIKHKSAMLMTIIDGMEKAYQDADSTEQYSSIYDDIQDFLQKISGFRRSGLSRGGEMDDNNIIYKVLRRNGHLQKVWDLSDKLFDKIYSQD